MGRDIIGQRVSFRLETGFPLVDSSPKAKSYHLQMAIHLSLRSIGPKKLSKMHVSKDRKTNAYSSATPNSLKTQPLRHSELKW